ncbi:hypothetical protein B9Z55_012894 [Caenorhabditis nigoni]|uniref:Uncharacterized protein n=1 Tax=Caenorhabditis nigoni TaxID=1611254 RepID=A0A2G5TZH7_9PELO|nr:hypothetical protein B9Z55_012894 [Caenorhabditis nigoni]
MEPAKFNSLANTARTRVHVLVRGRSPLQPKNCHGRLPSLWVLTDSGHQSQKNRGFVARTGKARQADLSLHLWTNWRTSDTGRQFLTGSTKIKPNL